jgi:hypothetical protein
MVSLSFSIAGLEFPAEFEQPDMKVSEIVKKTERDRQVTSRVARRKRSTGSLEGMEFPAVLAQIETNPLVITEMRRVRTIKD